VSDDKIVNFPGTNGPESKEDKSRVTADDVLTAALGEFEDVIVIGVGPNKAKCISSLPLQLAVFELSRAIHRIHNRPDLL